jgi:hypothetical protein
MQQGDYGSEKRLLQLNQKREEDIWFKSVYCQESVARKKRVCVYLDT